MSYQWRKVRQQLNARDVNHNAIEEDLRRIADSCYGPIVAPLSREPVCLLGGKRSGLEAAFIKMYYPGATIFILASDRPQEMSEYTYIRNISDLRDLLPVASGRAIDFCRIDEVYFTDTLISELQASGLKINYLCGAFLSTVRTPYQLHRDLSAISEMFYIRRLWDDFSLAKTEPETRNYVSVIVPAYGVEKYLPQCLHSLTNQTIRNIEIIVVNDGAKDRSGQVADDWAAKHPDVIKVIHKKNGGCASARNAGLDAATGYYVGFVDGDDWVSPHMFEDLVNAVLPGFKDIGQCGYVEAYEEGGSCKRFGHEPMSDTISFPFETSYKPDYILNAPSIWRRIYRRQFLLRNDLHFNSELKRFDDLPFAYLTLSLASSVTIIPEAHYYYRMGRPGQDISLMTSDYLSISIYSIISMKS